MQRGGKPAEMQVKSESPSKVAHPKHYVIFNVMGGRAQPVSPQAFALPFLFLQTLFLERGSIFRVGNYRTEGRPHLCGRGSCPSRSFFATAKLNYVFSAMAGFAKWLHVGTKSGIFFAQAKFHLLIFLLRQDSLHGCRTVTTVEIPSRFFAWAKY